MDWPLILWIPGVSCTPKVFKKQLAALDGIATSIVVNQTCGTSIPSIASGILKRAPDRFGIVGFSFGGYVALEIVRQASDRIDRLALLNTSARPESEQNSVRRLDRIRRAQEGEHADILSEQFYNMVHPDQRNNVELLAIWKDMGIEYGLDAFIRTMTASSLRPDARSVLDQIRCPTLVLTGEADQVVPTSRSEEIVNRVSQAELVILKACGHLSPLEQPALLSSALDRWIQSENVSCKD